MPDSLQVKVASPEGLAFSATALMVELLTTTGIIQVLPGHVDLITTLLPGEMILTDQTGETSFALGGGFACISAGAVTVLCDFARNEESILLEEAEKARLRAEEALRNTPGMTEEEQRQLQAALEYATVEIQIKKTRGKRGARPRSSGAGGA